ncbi:MAG: hypothetical protein M3Q29_08075 [Chloroflexota bacterium]|nr:hypothetical protein [Chloroflexota bacterium]
MARARRRGRRGSGRKMTFNPARAFLATRAFRRQMKAQGSGDMFSMAVGAFVAWRTFRSQKRDEQLKGARERTTLREVLGG